MAFLAHPVDRFVSAFFQSYKQPNYDDCNFLRCEPRSVLSRRYSGGAPSRRAPPRDVTPSEFALWEPLSEVEVGFNVATWYLGYNGDEESNSVNTKAQAHPVRDDKSGRRMLALAKARLEELDFIGLAGRFSESLEVMAWQLGAPLDRFCSCNINAFKRSADAYTANSEGDSRDGRGEAARGGATAHGELLPLSTEAREAVMKNNALDMELYAHGVKLYERQLAAFRRDQRRTAAAVVGSGGSATAGDNAGSGFVCDKGRMMCMEKSYLGAGSTNFQIKWFTPSTFVKRNKRYIKKGWHSSCSYMCYRQACVNRTAVMA